MIVWVILPAFNEAANLAPLLDGLAATLGTAAVNYRLIVVDDGSRDETRSVAQEYARRLPVEVIAHPHNRGLASAIQTGLGFALASSGPGDIVVTMDADNTHPSPLLLPMIEQLKAGHDIVIASRYATGSVEDGVSLLRRVLSRGVSMLLRIRFRLPKVRDYSSGYRAYRASLLRAAAAAYGPRFIEGRGFVVMAELLVKLQPFHPAIAEVPFRLRYGSKIGRSKLRLLRTIWEYLALVSRRPPRIARAGDIQASLRGGRSTARPGAP